MHFSQHAKCFGKTFLGGILIRFFFSSILGNPLFFCFVVLKDKQPFTLLEIHEKCLL